MLIGILWVSLRRVDKALVSLFLKNSTSRSSMQALFRTAFV